MLELLLWWLFVAFIIAIVLGVVLYFVTRWLFMRTAEKMAAHRRSQRRRRRGSRVHAAGEPSRSARHPA